MMKLGTVDTKKKPRKVIGYIKKLEGSAPLTTNGGPSVLSRTHYTTSTSSPPRGNNITRWRADVVFARFSFDYILPFASSPLLLPLATDLLSLCTWDLFRKLRQTTTAAKDEHDDCSHVCSWLVRASLTVHKRSDPTLSWCRCRSSSLFRINALT